jgi:hypothetical protein
MLKKLIRNIRQKPKGARDGVAFGVAMIFSLMVFSLWAFNTPARMAAIQEPYANNSKEDSNSSFGSLFGGIKEQFATAIESVQVPTTTSETELNVSTQKSTSSVIMPSVEQVVDSINKSSKQTAEASTSSSAVTPETKENEVSGREVRIITTQSTSSASYDRP